MSEFRPPRFREVNDMDQKLKAATARLKDGEPGKASRVLVSKGMAPVNADTLAKLEEIHPPSVWPDEPPLRLDITVNRLTRQVAPTGQSVQALPKPSKTSVTKVVKTLPKKSAPGPSGWTFGMISRGIKASPAFRDFLVSLVSAINNDNQVPAADWLRSSMLFPLKKKDDGIRPIACGEAFARLAAKVALSSINPADHLLPEQYGVGTGVDETLCHINDSIHLATNGISSLDLTNAFNTVSRHHLASVLGVSVPSLLGYFRWGYGVASDLFVRGPKSVHVIKSREGGRQGDPMFPFFFSLAIRPLVDQLANQFALKVSLADKDGNIVEKRLVWAYLDDITLALRPGVTHQDIIDYLSDPEILQAYGLSLNPSKSWYMSQPDLSSLGHKLLGSWIGGPDDDSSGARELVQAALDKLKSIIPILKMMPLQHALLLLRLCYYPILNHLLRTLPTEIGNNELDDFDYTIWRTIRGWVNDDSVSPMAREIIQLPKRLGGLGFFDSRATRPYAAAASYIQSRGSVLSRNLVLTDRLEMKLKGSLDQFATDLDKAYDDLFDEELWKENDLQRRGAELDRERMWADIFSRLSDYDKIRFLEAPSILRRKWIDSLPVIPSQCLSDEEVRYGLQELLLSQFKEAQGPTRTCSDCIGTVESPLHHLTCSATGMLRTTRHTAINSCIEQAMKEAGASAIVHSPYVGMAVDGTSRIGDTAATIKGVRSNFDYTVTTASYSARIRIPPEQEILEQIEVDKARGTRNLERFLFWEDHSDETPHPSTLKIRKLRQILFQETIGKDLGAADRTKYLHYGELSCVPVSFTARGGMGKRTVALVDNLCTCRPDWDFSDRVVFRSHLLGRLSVCLLRCAHKMKCVRADRTMDGL